MFLQRYVPYTTKDRLRLQCTTILVNRMMPYRLMILRKVMNQPIIFNNVSLPNLGHQMSITMHHNLQRYARRTSRISRSLQVLRTSNLTLRVT